MTSKKIYDNISELLFERFKKATKNNLKKLLTNGCDCDIINELLLRQTTTKNLDN